LYLIKGYRVQTTETYVRVSWKITKKIWIVETWQGCVKREQQSASMAVVERGLGYSVHNEWRNQHKACVVAAKDGRFERQM